MGQGKTIKLGRLCLSLFTVAVIALATYYRDVIRDWFLDDAKYDHLIAQAGRRHGVDSRLIKAVIYRESRFNPAAVGKAGEIGLMQIMWKFSVQDWAKEHETAPPGAGTLFSPQLNIEIGAWYLARALAQWRDYKHGVELALCQYNAGDKRAQNWKPANYDGEVVSRITIKSARSYVETIMKKYREYCKKGVMQP